MRVLAVSSFLIFLTVQCAPTQTAPIVASAPASPRDAAPTLPPPGKMLEDTYINADVGVRIPVPHAWILAERLDPAFLDVVLKPVLGSGGAAEFTVVDTSVYPNLATGMLFRQQDKDKKLEPLVGIRHVTFDGIDYRRYDYHADARTPLPFQSRLSVTMRGWRLLITLDASSREDLDRLVEKFKGLQFLPPHDTFAKPPTVAGPVTLGYPVKEIPPQYPEIARKNGVQGKVELEALIGKDGKVKNLYPLSGPDLLIAPAMSAVVQWQYKPFLLGGTPIEVESYITVNFTLGN